MKIIRRMLLIPILLVAPALALAAPATKSSTGKSTAKKSTAKKTTAKPKALFTSVKGSVRIKKGSSASKPAKKDATASVGDRIVTSKDSSATLRFFDGTELRLSPATEIRINNLTEGEKDKTLKFKLYLGKILANVKKLATPRSSFEIEAGGVVCGVRGTIYSMEYDPDKGTLSLDVDEGTVFSNSNGDIHNFNAGQGGNFLNGDLLGGTTGNPSGNEPPGGSSSNNNPAGGAADALGDLNTTVGGALESDGDSTFNDPSVGGGVKVNVIVNVGVNETGP